MNPVETLRKPKYLLCRDQIAQLIIALGIKTGELIPSITQLIGLLRTGRTNIQNALAVLCEEGILEKKAGSGCYLKRTPGERTVEPAHEPRVAFVDYLSGPLSLSSVQTVRVGVLIEMTHFSPMWRELATDFKRSCGLTVELVAINSLDEIDSLNLDVFQIPNYLLAEWAGCGRLDDLETLGVGFDQEAFIPSARKMVGYYGKLWGIPMVCGSGCLYFNRAESRLSEALNRAEDIDALLGVFEDYGKTMPRNYAAVTRNCHVLTDYLKYSGTAVYHTTAEMIEAIASPQVRNWLQQNEQFFRNDKIFYGLDTKSFSSSVDLFKSGLLPTIVGNTSSILQIFRHTDFPLGAMAMPITPGGAGELVSFINVVSSVSRRQDEAAAFLEFVSREEVQRKFAEQGRLVANRNALSGLVVSPLDERSTRGLIRALEQGTCTMLEQRRYGEFIASGLIADTDLWQQGVLTLDRMIERTIKGFNRIK